MAAHSLPSDRMIWQHLSSGRSSNGIHPLNGVSWMRFSSVVQTSQGEDNRDIARRRWRVCYRGFPTQFRQLR